MLESIPSLISTIQMVQAVSRYYNTSERMTSLFVKVRRGSGKQPAAMQLGKMVPQLHLAFDYLP